MIANQYSDQNQLYMALGYCAFMLLLGWLLKKFPPKKINHLYGYRTQRSMKNQATWEAANTYSTLVFFKVSLYGFFSRLLSMKCSVSTRLFSCFSLCAAAPPFSTTARVSGFIGVDIEGYPADDITEQGKRAEQEK